MNQERSRKKRLGIMLVEVLAIALGVFLSLWADEWRANRNLTDDRTEALERLQSDLANDTVDLTRLSDLNDRSVNAIRSILSLDPGEVDTPAEMAELIPFSLESWILQTSGQEYEALRSSGRLGLITSSELLSKLAEYYKQQEYIGALFADDLKQTRVVRTLLNPHVEFPREMFTTARRPVAPLTTDPSFIPVPTVEPSVAQLVMNRVFVNEMIYLGLYKQLLVNALRANEAMGNVILELISAELNN